DPGAQYRAVREVLGEIGAEQVPELVVANKSDLVDPADLPAAIGGLPGHGAGSIVVSARTGTGVDELVEAIAGAVDQDAAMVELFVPYSHAESLAALHREGQVTETEATDEGVRVVARLDDQARGQFADLVVEG